MIADQLLLEAISAVRTFYLSFLNTSAVCVCVCMRGGDVLFAVDLEFKIRGDKYILAAA